MLKGENIGVLPIRELHKISDLIFYDGPILSHFKDRYGCDFLFYWVDYDSNYNRWLVFQVTELQLYKFILRAISLRNLFDSPVNNFFYSVEIGDKLEYNNVVLIYKEELPLAYYPEESSLFEFEIPSVYSHSKIKFYQENELMEAMIENGIFFRAESADAKNLKLLGVLDAADFLYNLGMSYKNLIVYSVKKIFSEKLISDNARINRAIQSLKNGYEPNLVKTAIGSFEIGLSPNPLADTTETFLDREWKDSLFENFKNDVIEVDNKNVDEIGEMIAKYGDTERSSIYKPIIDLYNNEKLSIEVTNKEFKPTRKVKPIKKDFVETILGTEKQKNNEEHIERLALVKQNTKTNRVSMNQSEITLFEQNIQTSKEIDEIRSFARTYVLRRIILVEHKLENGLYFLKSFEFDIDVSGETLLDAERAFYEEFDSLFTQYKQASDENLTEEEIYVKTSMMLVVAKIIEP